MSSHPSAFAQTFSRAVLLTMLLPLFGCARPSSENASTLADAVTQKVGCESFESNFFDQLYKFPQTGRALPSEIEMREAFSAVASGGRLKRISVADQMRVSDELSELYRLLTVDAANELGHAPASSQEWLGTLSALELGDSSTPEKERLQAQIKEQMAKVNRLTGPSSGMDQATCAPATPTPNQVSLDLSVPASDLNRPNSLFVNWKATQSPVVYGALKTMSTAYQSCQAGLVPILNAKTEDAVGVRIVGTHPDGIGKKRVISNIRDLLKTNPYLENYRRPSSNCFDVTKNVPIYDYGGRPSTETGTFDLFKNAGSGTSALGTDCSGYVFMAIATSGLRVKKGAPLKAVSVSGITSTMFTNPQKNGLTCFDYVQFKGTDTLRAGDIIAKAGHVVIVKSAGSDPFGLNDIARLSDCKLANMDVSRFDFVLLQDSPSKGGIGIQASNAADYLAQETVMPLGLREAAVTACRAKFGAAGTAKNENIAVVRHSGSSECMNGSEIKMEHESCVASCPMQTSSELMLASQVDAQ